MADPCDSPEARQFDFWIGDWIVEDPAGKVVGRNRIEAILDGCVLLETWTSESPHRGTSVNIWDAGQRRWHQTWVDNSGLLLQLDGEFRDGANGANGANGAMVLEGERPKREAPDVTVRHRISWSLLDGDPDRVRQHWEVSDDGGAAWQTLFDGRYRRAP